MTCCPENTKQHSVDKIFVTHKTLLNFVLFNSLLCLNMKVLPKNIFYLAIIKGDTIVPLILRFRRIDFSLY